MGFHVRRIHRFRGPQSLPAPRRAIPAQGPHRRQVQGHGEDRRLNVLYMSMTVVEKILARASGLPTVKAGNVVEPKVDLAMSHENAALVINQFLEIYKGTARTPKIWDPNCVALIFDHRVPAESAK